MARSLLSIVETKKNKLKRRSGKIAGDAVRAIGLVMVVACLSMVLIYVYSVTLTASYFQLEDIVVRGTERVDEKEIVEISGTGSHNNVFSINIKELSGKIETHPWIKDVSMGREFPNRLVVEVRERRPAALVLRNGCLYIMDWDGELFKKYDKTDDVHLPIVNANAADENINEDLMKKSLTLLDCLSSTEKFPTMENVSEIFGDRIYGFSLYTEGGLCLQLGFRNYDRKLRRLEPVLVDLTRKKVKKVFLSIDLTDEKKIVVKKNNILRPKKHARGYTT